MRRVGQLFRSVSRSSARKTWTRTRWQNGGLFLPLSLSFHDSRSRCPLFFFRSFYLWIEQRARSFFHLVSTVTSLSRTCFTIPWPPCPLWLSKGKNVTEDICNRSLTSFSCSCVQRIQFKDRLRRYSRRLHLSFFQLYKHREEQTETTRCAIITSNAYERSSTDGDGPWLDSLLTYFLTDEQCPNLWPYDITSSRWNNRLKSTMLFDLLLTVTDNVETKQPDGNSSQWYVEWTADVWDFPSLSVNFLQAI